MGDGYDRFENERGGGGGFVMGLLTGTVLGAGLGMLFAPKAGSELRNQLSEQAGNLANTASESARRAGETASQWADKGREAAGEWAGKGRQMYDKARDAVSKGADEAQRYVQEATSGTSPSASPITGSGTTSSGSSYGSAYGSGEQTRGSASDPASGSTDPRRM